MSIGVNITRALVIASFGAGMLLAETTVPPTRIYPDAKAAHEDLSKAFKEARTEHKRVLLDFGADWCADCVVLDRYFHNSENNALLKQHYVLVDVNIGLADKNLDLIKEYGIDLQKGVPALVVLGSDRKIIFVQKQGEFEDMRKMDSSTVRTFLEKWK